MFKKLSVFLVLVSIFLIRCNEDEDNNDVFVPTKQWQGVKKGQKIPKGLHVRINLETGQTEAKLLDDDDKSEDKTKALSSIPEEIHQEENPSQNTIPKSTLEEAVKNIKSDHFSPEEIKKIKDQFRSYDDLKKSLKELNLTPKLDAEIIADLVKNHKEVVSAEKLDKAELLKILEDLEFLAHQYDNAHEFVKQDGFKDIIYKNLNSSKVDVKMGTLKLMVALMQNNVAPKIHALETGSIAIILRLINLDPDSGVKLRALTALGALLRSLPAAQRKFIESGGLSVLAKNFDTDNIKVQIKLVTMISDLLVEHQWAGNDGKISKHYSHFDLTKRILEHDWCKKLNKLLLGLLITDKDDHDSIEKCLIAMHSLRAECRDQYEKELLMSLRNRYKVLGAADTDSSSSFFHVLKELCDEILHHVHTSAKTEL